MIGTVNNIEFYYGDPSPLNGMDDFALMMREIKPTVTEQVAPHAHTVPPQYDYNKNNVQIEQPVIGLKKQLFNNATNWLLCLIAFLLFLIFVQQLKD